MLIGMRHPDNKLVTIATNPRPDAVYPETDQFGNEVLASVTPESRKTPQEKRDLQVTSILATNSTPVVPNDDLLLFNATVERLLSTPLTNKSRIADTRPPMRG